jgi:magnesium-transporting ATPase (P-type)
MITGDHPMTALYIGLECGLVEKDVDLIFVDVVDKEVVFKDINSKEMLDISKVESKLSYGNIELVVTGAAFKELNILTWLQPHLDGEFHY